jgi:hypothetical protein
MERQKALIASAIVAVTLMTGAVAYAAASGLTDGRTDTVGQLQPVATQPATVTVYVDPATGAVTTTAPAANAPTAPATPDTVAVAQPEPIPAATGGHDGGEQDD